MDLLMFQGSSHGGGKLSAKGQPCLPDLWAENQLIHSLENLKYGVAEKMIFEAKPQSNA